MAIKQLWFEKYRPKTLGEYVFQDAQQERTVRQWIAEGQIPHLLFTGVQQTSASHAARSRPI